MPEHLRALVVILVLAGTVFAFARAPLTAALIAPADFIRRRNLWLALTLTAFLAHNFWLYIVIGAVLLAVAARADSNRVALALFVLLAIPPINDRIGAFGLVNYLFDIDHLRLVSLAVLLPAFLAPAAPGERLLDGAPGRLLLGYAALNVVLAAPEASATGTARAAFLAFIDVIVPYAVASRLTRTLEAQRSAAASYVAGAAVMAAIGAFEIARHWLLYSSLPVVYGIKFGGEYLMRDEALRATATSGQAIPFGFALAIAFALTLGLRPGFPGRASWLAALGLLALGMIASFSRGPWVGALVGALVFVLTGPGAMRVLARLAIGGGALALVAIATPLGDRLLHPVTVEGGSYAYRQRVIEAALNQILEHPWLGNADFIYAPEIQELKQGQGIIDIVNTYAGIGLASGLVGLALFIGVFATAMLALWRRVRAEPEGSDARALGRGLLAAMACMLVTIGTVSSISAIPITCYLLAGLASGYALRARPAEQALPSMPAILPPLARAVGHTGGR